MNRRELVVSFARLTGLVALGSTAGILLVRSGSADDDACRPQPCSGCPSFTDCSRPQAVAAKTEVDHGRV